MPRHRHSSSESSSAESSDDSRHNRSRRGKQQPSADRQRQRKQRSDSSDSSPHSQAIPSKVHMSHKSKRKSPIHKRRSLSEESDSSPIKERKGGSRSRLSESGKKRHSVDRNERRKRSSSGNSSGSPHRTKKSSRKRSPSGKRERRKSSSESDTNEPSSPSKPLLASRVNYMKSLNPDRSKRVVKQKSPSRRKVQSLADDYKRQEQPSRWRVESLADDYRKNRYRTSDRDNRDRRDRDERSPKRRSPRQSPKRRSADRESPQQERSPARSSQRRRSRDRSSERQNSPVRRSPERKSTVKQRSPQRKSSEDRSSERRISPTKRSVEKRSQKRQYQKHGSSEMERSPVRISPNKQRLQRRRSPEDERSPDRQRDPVRRSDGSSQDRQRSPIMRLPEKQRAPARRSLERPLVRQSPERQNSFDKRSSDRRRSSELQSPLKRDPVRRPVAERSQRRNSPEAIVTRRLSADRIPQERQLTGPRVPVGKLSGRPLGRRRSEERLQSRLSPERSFTQRSSLERPLRRRSPALSPLRQLDRRRSTERSSLVRRSMERTSDQRYLDFSPPRLMEQRTRARSLERMPRRPENDRFLRDSQRQMQSNRFRRDSDRGLYDDIPEPLAMRRSPPLERRWRDDSEYLNRYRDDMDLPQRSVYVDRAVSVRVLNDRPTDSEEALPFRYRDHRGNKPFNRAPNFQRRWQGKGSDSFNVDPDLRWSGVRNSRPVDMRESQRDQDSHTGTMAEPKRRRLESHSRKDSFSPERKNRSFENAARSKSPVHHGSELVRENRRAKRQQSSSESDEGYAAPGSKLSSTVTMVTKKHSRSRSPAVHSKTKKRISASLEREGVLSNRDVSESPERSSGERVDPLPTEKDKSDRKRPRSPGRPVRGRTDTDPLETEKLTSKKESSRSPRKSRRDQREPDMLEKDRSGSSKKTSRSPVRSPIKRLDSDISEPERAKSDKSSRSYQLSPRDRIDSVASEQEEDFSRKYEMERMDSFVSSEQEFGRSHERERFDSTTSEQEMRDRLGSVEGEEEGEDVRNSDPESGELTDSDKETQKRNALIKSLVNKPSLEELAPDEEERQRIEDERYLEKKRQVALARLEGEKETVASTVVKVTDSRRDKGEDGRGERDDRRDSRRDRNRDEKRDSKRKRHNEDISGNKPDTSQPEQEPATKKAKPDPTGVEALTMRTGGAYIPPARLRAMQESITDKSSVAYQRMSWEALKKSINGLINKVNVSNIEFIVREIFQENIVRGRGLMARSIIQAQAASPTFTHVYAALVAIVNTKFPQNGELVLRRLVVQFRRGFKRNDKTICLSTTRFVAHLVNQQVAHEVLALEILTLLLETPTDDSVEIAVGFLKESGQKLTEVTPRGVNAIFERLRNVLHEGTIDTRVQYMVEVMFAVRKDGFKDHPSVLEDLDLVEEEDQFTHLLTLEDAGDPENMLNVFKADPDFLENEEKYKILKKEILDEGSSDEEGGGGSGSDSDSEDSEDNEGEGEKQTIIDQTETNLVALRRTIYLTIQSSLDFEECAHKLMKMELKPGQEVELCNMVLDCCAQMRTYEKFFGLLAQRFCMIDKKYIEPFQIMFKEQYETIHRLETNKLRNVAKFFAHLLHTDAISWGVLSCIRLNEEDTSSASRIFIKILIQELSEYMGLPNLNDRLKDPTLQEYFEGLLPRDNPRNTRFAINFFTTIGLGGLTDDLRDHLKNVSKKLMEQKQQEQEAAESSSGSESESSASESNSEESSGSSEEERKKKKKKRGEKGKEKEKSKKDKRGKKSVSNGAVEKQGKKSKKGKSGVQDESVQKRAERLRQLANYDADAGEVNIEDSRTRARDDSIERHKGKDMSKGHKEIKVSRTRDNDNFDRPRDISGEREVRGRRERILSDDDSYRDQEMETGRRRYREVERQVSYDDSENDRRGRLDRSFDRVDRYDNRYQDLDGMNARDNDNFGEGYDRRGRNEYRNLDRGDDRREKRGFGASNLGYRNNRGRPRGDGRMMDRNFGRNRSEERMTRMPREDRRDDRRRRR